MSVKPTGPAIIATEALIRIVRESEDDKAAVEIARAALRNIDAWHAAALQVEELVRQD